MEDLSASISPPDKGPAVVPDNLRTAIQTVSRHALKTGLGATPDEQAAFSAAWSGAQIRLLLSYMERHAATAETSLASLPDGELRQALGIVLRDAADRCAVLSRDLDLARGETLGLPDEESAKRTAMSRRIGRAHGRAAGIAGRSL